MLPNETHFIIKQRQSKNEGMKNDIPHKQNQKQSIAIFIPDKIAQFKICMNEDII